LVVVSNIPFNELSVPLTILGPEMRGEGGETEVDKEVEVEVEFETQDCESSLWGRGITLNLKEKYYGKLKKTEDRRRTARASGPGERKPRTRSNDIHDSFRRHKSL
jgi:hypothetical protein